MGRGQGPRPSRHLTPDQYFSKYPHILIPFKEATKPVTEIAREAGVSRQRVYAIARKAGLKIYRDMPDMVEESHEPTL